MLAEESETSTMQASAGGVNLHGHGNTQPDKSPDSTGTSSNKVKKNKTIITKKRFGPCKDGRPNKAQPSTATPARRQPSTNRRSPTATISSAAANSMKDLTKEQLLRKARDLSKLKDKNAITVRELKSEIAELKQQVDAASNQSQDEVVRLARELKKKDAFMVNLKEQHEMEMTNERAAHDNRIQALNNLHTVEIRKRSVDHREQCKKATADRKASNVVSTRINLSLVVFVLMIANNTCTC